MTSPAEMVRTMCAQVDSGDASGFAAWFAPDATYTFGNGDPLVGREAIAAATAGATSTLPWVRHEVEQVAEIGDQLFCRFLIHTATPAGEAVALPCVTVIWMRDGEIADYRVHMDLAPVLTVVG